MNWVEFNPPIPFGSNYSKDAGFTELDSMSKRDLCKPGTLVQLTDGSKYLIGDTNALGGVCDCCTELDRHSMVARYAIVWKDEE